MGDGRRKFAVAGGATFEGETEPIGRGTGTVGEVVVVGLGEVDQAPVVPEVRVAQLRMTIEAEPGHDDRVELAGKEVRQVERSELLLLKGFVGGGAGEELEAVSSLDALDALAFEVGVERPAGAAVGVAHE